MNQFEPAQVIMLPTKVSNIYKDRLNKLWYWASPTLETSIAQHLYIISDDEIKVGDNVFNIKDNHYGGTVNENNLLDAKLLSYIKKIIATTDSSLGFIIPRFTSGNRSAVDVSEKVLLPQPSQQFIEQYIEYYNKGAVITDVLVEYKWYHNKQSCFKTMCYKQDMEGRDSCVGMCEAQRIKVNPKDNTINIKPIKESWNREELDFELNRLLNKALKDKNLVNHPDSNNVAKWIKENL